MVARILSSTVSRAIEVNKKQRLSLQRGNINTHTHPPDDQNPATSPSSAYAERSIERSTLELFKRPPTSKTPADLASLTRARRKNPATSPSSAYAEKSIERRVALKIELFKRPPTSKTQDGSQLQSRHHFRCSCVHYQRTWGGNTS